MSKVIPVGGKISNRRSTKAPKESISDISDREKVGLIRSRECFHIAPFSENMPVPKKGKAQLLRNNPLAQS